MQQNFKGGAHKISEKSSTDPKCELTETNGKTSNKYVVIRQFDIPKSVKGA